MDTITDIQNKELYSLDTQRDTYIFMCCNIRDKRVACGNRLETDSVYEYFRLAINQKRPLLKEGRIVKVNKSGCLSRCADGPNIVIFPENIWYNYANTQDIDEIISEHLILGKVVKRLQVIR